MIHSSYAWSVIAKLSKMVADTHFFNNEHMVNSLDIKDVADWVAVIAGFKLWDCSSHLMRLNWALCMGSSNCKVDGDDVDANSK